MLAGDHLNVFVGPQRGLPAHLRPLRVNAVESLLLEFSPYQQAPQLLSHEIQVTRGPDLQRESFESPFPTDQGLGVFGEGEAGAAVRFADRFPAGRGLNSIGISVPMRACTLRAISRTDNS